MHAQQRLLQWYRDHHRDLPWRKTSDPYVIWLSEVILQQTRVEQGLPYFLKFLKAYPTVKKLAAAPEQEVLKLWQGLGYYSRARNLLATAKQISAEFKGVFPGNFEGLLHLKGVGAYTAAAIASFAYDEAVAVVDGNVNRVLSRYYGVTEPVNATAGQKIIAERAQSFLNKKHPGLHNQAVMELGALVCKPIKPECEGCPLSKECVALQTGQQEQLPVKKPKVKVRTEYYYYFLFLNRGKIGLVHRKPGSIWQHLYDLPLISSEKKLSSKQLEASLATLGWVDPKTKPEKLWEHRHLLTHRRIEATFYVFDNFKSGKNDPAEEWVSSHSLKDYPVSRLLEKFLEKFNTLLPC